MNEIVKYISLIQVYLILNTLCLFLQLNTEWAQVESIDLLNDGSGLGFGIIGGRSTGVVVKTILPGGVADRVSTIHISFFYFRKNNTENNYAIVQSCSISGAIPWNAIIICIYNYKNVWFSIQFIFK